LIFNFDLEYTIRKIQERWRELEMNGTQNLIYADVNILGVTMNTIEEHY
jgi:hypothetical protein